MTFESESKAERVSSQAIAPDASGEANVTVEPTPAPRAASPVGREPQKYISAHAPLSLGLAIDLAVVELSMSGFACNKGELLAALVHRHVKSDDAKLADLRKAIERYRRDFA